jgi:hypothetical protein
MTAKNKHGAALVPPTVLPFCTTLIVTCLSGRPESSLVLSKLNYTVSKLVALGGSTIEQEDSWVGGCQITTEWQSIFCTSSLPRLLDRFIFPISLESGLIYACFLLITAALTFADNGTILSFVEWFQLPTTVLFASYFFENSIHMDSLLFLQEE